MKFATKLYNTTHLTLGMLLHYLGKLKIQIFCCPVVCRYCSNLLTKYCELLSHANQIASSSCEIRNCNVILNFVNVLLCFVRNNL